VAYEPGFFVEDENRVNTADNPFFKKVVPMVPE
jgi:hypothetical protein